MEDGTVRKLAFDILIRFAWTCRESQAAKSPYQPQPQGGERQRGRQEEKSLHSVIFAVCFHGDGSGSWSELSQWKQTAAPIHHGPSHTGHTAELSGQGGAPGRGVGAGLPGALRKQESVKPPLKAKAGRAAGSGDLS